MRWGTKKQMENTVNLCYFASAEVGEPLQRDCQDIRGPVDCETFGCRHFLFAPEAGKRRLTLNDMQHELIYMQDSCHEKKAAAHLAHM